ncbi:TetR/AcrR family transcriptional regulator [Nonomuraea fastidiosa]|uniref:TetR/AcrR family transcriptional regulator n=1 Tax=Nonomuraea TaxID=83681 RepID=UPI00324A69AF
MRKNPERRRALIDAAVEVLAREGARGLTFRAVDAGAGVPVGTASNYFSSRDDLFTQVGGRIYERLLPDEATIARSRESLNWLIVERLTLPEIFTEQEIHDLVDVAVRRMLSDD